MSDDKWYRILTLTDDCICAMTTKSPGPLPPPVAALDALPPWRAHQLAILGERLSLCEPGTADRYAEKALRKSSAEDPDVVRADLAANGHGHVVPTTTGALCRCGGPALCSTCRADQARLTAAENGEPRP